MDNTNLSPIEVFMLSIQDADTFIAALGPDLNKEQEEDNSWIYDYNFPN